LWLFAGIGGAGEKEFQEKKEGFSMFDAKVRLEGFQKGVGTLMEEMPNSINSLFEFLNAVQTESALSVREKELIAIGISIYTRCEDCISLHAQKALQAGCTRAEILEAAMMSVAFGGGPSLGATASLLLKALDRFEGEVQP
jgi:AhpD family alkylhydroperoxidase